MDNKITEVDLIDVRSKALEQKRSAELILIRNQTIARLQGKLKRGEITKDEFDRDTKPLLPEIEVKVESTIFDGYNDEQLAIFAEQAGLHKTIKKRETIISKLIEAKFTPAIAETV